MPNTYGITPLSYVYWTATAAHTPQVSAEALKAALRSIATSGPYTGTPITVSIGSVTANVDLSKKETKMKFKYSKLQIIRHHKPNLSREEHELLIFNRNWIKANYSPANNHISFAAGNTIRALRNKQKKYQDRKTLVAYVEMPTETLRIPIEICNDRSETKKILEVNTRDAIVSYRARSREMSVHPSHLETAMRVGGVHQYPGLFAKYFKNNKLKACYKPKSPKTQDRHVGIEIECFVNCDDGTLARDFVAAGLQHNIEIKDDGSLTWNGGDECDGSCRDSCECLNEDGEGTCECECTCSGNMNAVEIVVIAKESEYQKVISKVCKILSNHDAQVNQTCGLHVHIDQRNRDVRQSYSRLFNSLPLLASMVPESRRRNNYTRLNTLSTFEEQYRRDDRYCAINVKAFERHGTLEVRLHSGTTDRVKITRWITVLLGIVDSQTIAQQPMVTVESVPVSQRVKDWMRTRIAKFNPSLAQSVVTNVHTRINMRVQEHRFDSDHEAEAA